MQQRTSHALTHTALASALLILGAATVTSAHAGTTSKQNVAIKFVATAGDKVVNCDKTLKAMGSTAVNARLHDMRFYVSNISLIKVDGGVETLVPVALTADDNQLTSGGNTVALVDLETGNASSGGFCAGTSTTHSAIKGKVPKGTYTGMVMTLGVPEALNHSLVTSAAAPLNNPDMNWSWQSGRKFAKIELNPYNATTQTYTQGVAKFDASGNPTGTFNDTVNFHLGNIGCAVDATSPNGYSCSSDNTLTIRLDAFDYATQNVAIDLKALFANNNLQEEHGSAPGCMSGATDPECIAQWPALGSKFEMQTINGKSVWVSTHDLSDPFFHGLTVFRAIAK